MKKLLILFLVFFSLGSCDDYFENRTIKSLINETYISSSQQLKEVDLIKEDIYSLPYSSLVSEHFTEKYKLKRKNDYQLVRFIYKTRQGAYRMFYFVDLTDDKIIDKSSDPDDFYIPMYNSIFKDQSFEMDRETIIGQNTFELFRY